MECEICSRAPHESLDFFCAACARNYAYVPRLQNAQVLLEKATLAGQVEDIISPKQNAHSSTDRDGNDFNRKVWRNELSHVHINETRRNVDQSRLAQEQVKADCQELRSQISELKARITEKRRNLETTQKSISSDHDAHSSNLAAMISSVSSSLLRLQQKSISSRASLCREAGSLMRLRQRRRQKDALGKEQYSVAGLTLPDLRDISNVRCVDLTAVLGSVVHLVLLVAFYLGIRLPAEIKMPVPEHPLPTICAPSASYTGRKTDPSSTSSPSMPTSPSASKHEIGASLKPRPLSVGSDDREERIFNYQKREPHIFNLFVEGIALLAWDVAWLCRSQGFTVGTNSWEDICNIGKNLHQLLIAHPQVSNLVRIQSDRVLPKRSALSRKASPTLDETRKETVGKLGQHSDKSAASQATRSSQIEVTHNWEFYNWQAVALPLRKTLLTEIASADWELLKDQEWDDGGEQFDEAVFVKSRAVDGQQYDDAGSIMTTRTYAEDESSPAGRAPGTSGWTKLKSRDR